MGGEGRAVVSIARLRGLRRLGGLLVVAAALFSAGVLAVTALGRQGDQPLIVLDRSIGGIALGMSRSDVEGLLGAPGSTLAILLRGGGTGVLATYHVHGGELLVEYAGDRVVSIETTSSFYRTENGIGPGTSKAGLHGFHTDFCTLGLWDATAATPPEGPITVFDLAGDEIFSVTVTELGYYDLCDSAPADQELPDPRPSALLLRVTIDPDGFGYVRSSPYRIDCPLSCDRTFQRGQTVTLTATPSTGATFTGWSGACSGTGSCTLTLDADSSVTAHFTGTPFAPTTTTARPETTVPTTTTEPTTTDGTI